MIIRYGLIKKSKWVQNKTKKGLVLTDSTAVEKKFSLLLPLQPYE